MSYTEHACDLVIRAIMSCYLSKRDIYDVILSLQEEFDVSIVVDLDIGNVSVTVSVVSEKLKEHTIKVVSVPKKVLRYCFRCFSRASKNRGNC